MPLRASILCLNYSFGIVAETFARYSAVFLFTKIKWIFEKHSCLHFHTGQFYIFNALKTFSSLKKRQVGLSEVTWFLSVGSGNLVEVPLTYPIYSLLLLQFTLVHKEPYLISSHRCKKVMQGKAALNGLLS